MAAAAPSLAALPEACLLQVAATLPSRDLAALALAARRFGARRPAASSGGAPAEPLALAEEAARLRLLAEPADRRAQLPRDGVPPQPWPALLRERERLDAPLRFTRIGPRVALREGASVATRGGVTCHAGHRAALCGGRRLRAGRHYAELTLVDGKTELFGLCPAAFDAATGEAAHSQGGVWLYHPRSGKFVHGRGAFPNVVGGWERPRGDLSWCALSDGPARAKDGDVIGLLADFAAESLTVFVNGQRQGEFHAGSLAARKGVGSEEAVWVVDLGQQPGVFTDCVQIAPDAAPPEDAEGNTEGNAESNTASGGAAAGAGAAGGE